MIVFNNLNIQSFKSIFKLELDFKDLDNSFYLLEGKNNTQDFATSNGTGKTTLFDALAYALYGTTVGIYVKKEEYQNKNSKLPLKLVLNFDIKTNVNTNNYVVYRTLNSLQLFKDGVDISELTKTETEKKLADILDLSKDEFFNFTYISQFAGSSFFSKTASEKFNIVKDFIFGEDLIEIKNILDFNIKQTKEDIHKTELTLSKIIGNIESIQHIVKELTSGLNDAEEQLTEAEIQDKEKEIQEFLKVKHTIDDLNSDKDNLTQKFNTIKQKVKTRKQQLISIQEDNICPLCKQQLNNNEELKQKLTININNYIKEAKLCKQQYSDIVQKLSDLPKRKDVLKEIENIDNIIKSQRKSLENQNIDKNKLISETKKLEKEKIFLEENIEKQKDYLRQLTDLQKFFNTDFIQYLQKSFLFEVENYLNLYCYDVFCEDFHLNFNNNSLELFIGEHPYSYFSGGERQRIDFLFVFAIKLALQNFTDKNTNLFILDESLSAQDGDANEKCIELIDSLASAQSDLITILVSHRSTDVDVSKILLCRYNNKTTLEVFDKNSN